MCVCVQEAVPTAGALRTGHPEELPCLLLAQEVPAAALGGAHAADAPARSHGQTPGRADAG